VSKSYASFCLFFEKLSVKMVNSGVGNFLKYFSYRTRFEREASSFKATGKIN
jgi:hypothetical protein